MLISPLTKKAPKSQEDRSAALRPPRVPTVRMMATGPEAAKMNATSALTAYAPPKSETT
jgi:hypothetical protein